jgi:hypothetical protein
VIPNILGAEGNILTSSCPGQKRVFALDVAGIQVLTFFLPQDVEATPSFGRLCPAMTETDQEPNA